MGMLNGYNIRNAVYFKTIDELDTFFTYASFIVIACVFYGHRLWFFARMLKWISFLVGDSKWKNMVSDIFEVIEISVWLK